MHSSTVRNIMETTLKELEAALIAHDWYYQMSDDYKYYTAGRAEATNIRGLMQAAKDNNKGEEAERLYKWHRKSF